MRLKKLKVYKVIWRDAADAPQTWLDTEDIKKYILEHMTIESIGYIVSRDNNYIVMAADLTRDGAWGRVTKIPKSWVKKIERL